MTKGMKQYMETVLEKYIDDPDYEKIKKFLFKVGEKVDDLICSQQEERIKRFRAYFDSLNPTHSLH